MTVDERKRLLAHVFEEIRADAEGVTPLRPSEEWKPYMRAVVPLEGGSERKTGLVRINPPLRLTTDCHIHLLRRAA